MSANNGGPAFPNELQRNMTSGYLMKGGMTLRDYFAAKAMQGIIHNEADIDFSGKTVESAVASLSYRIADAMLAERAKGGAE